MLAYTLNKARIKGLKLENAWAQALIGFCAGACWSFLGIGGGPFNLAILVFFFAMESKPAAQASLFIIAFSQTASLIYTLATGSVPRVPPRGPAGHGGDGGAWVGRGAPPAAPDGLGGGR